MKESTAAFGAFCNAAFEGMTRDLGRQIREETGCEVCVDGGFQKICGDRAWGSTRPKPEPGKMVENEAFPWCCTRAPDHPGDHVACNVSDHGLYTWGSQDSLRSAICLLIPTTLLLEINEVPIPGKFVRRPKLEKVARPAEKTIYPIIDYQLNPNGTWRLRVLPDYDDSMVIDCPDSIFQRIPNTRICEGDILAKDRLENIEQGNRTLRNFNSGPISLQLYESISEICNHYAQLYPVENDTLREFFEGCVKIANRYEKEHGMVV